MTRTREIIGDQLELLCELDYEVPDAYAMVTWLYSALGLNLSLGDIPATARRTPLLGSDYQSGDVIVCSGPHGVGGRQISIVVDRVDRMLRVAEFRGRPVLASRSLTPGSGDLRSDLAMLDDKVIREWFPLGQVFEWANRSNQPEVAIHG